MQFYRLQLNLEFEIYLFEVFCINVWQTVMMFLEEWCIFITEFCSINGPLERDVLIQRDEAQSTE